MANVVYCRNGHHNGWVPKENQSYRYHGAWHEWDERQVREKLQRLAFCPTCGAENIAVCLSCKTTIEDDEEHIPDRPSYCGSCGKPFPWTETARAAADEFTDDLPLSADEKTALKATLNDLAVDSPRTELAAHRFKKALLKIGPTAGDVLRTIVVNFATAAAKKWIGG